jgi:hypothetical protein
MSSVSGSNNGGSGQDDTVRRVREDARKREAELIKKNAKQIAAADKKHAEEVAKIEEKHNASLQNLRDKSSEGMTRRDQKYQNEMNEIRNLHTKQLERLMTDSEEKVQAQRAASKSEVKQSKLGKEDRVGELHEKYAVTLDEQRKNFDHQVDEMRTDQKQSTEKTRKELTDAHKKELEGFRDYHNETTSDLKNDLRTTRNSATQRLRNQEVRHFNEKMRLNDTNMATMKQKDVDFNEIQSDSREGYQESVKELRSKFARAQEEEAARRSGIEEAWKADVNDRIDSRERRLEQQLVAEKQNNIREKNKIDRGAKGEVNAMRSDYQKKFDYLEQARRDTLTQANRNNAEDIAKVRKEIGDSSRASNRQMQESTEIEVMRNRQALQAAKQEGSLREAYQREQADSRVMNIREESDIKDARMREKYGSNIDVMREGYEQEIRELRLAAEKDKGMAIGQMKEEYQKNEMEHQRQMAGVVAKYEKRISELNDQFVREKRLRDNREKQLVDELKKGQDSQLEAVKIKYEEQNKQANVQHEKELRDVSRRHKDQVDNIISTIKKT